MNPILVGEIEQKRIAVAELCRKYAVHTLDLFGSGTGDQWRPGDSDLDFVVTFRASNSDGLADRYIGLAEELERLFNRPVDLITPASIRNPYFREQVESSRSRIYAE